MNTTLFLPTGKRDGLGVLCRGVFGEEAMKDRISWVAQKTKLTSYSARANEGLFFLSSSSLLCIALHRLYARRSRQFSLFFSDGPLRSEGEKEDINIEKKTWYSIENKSNNVRWERFRIPMLVCILDSLDREQGPVIRFLCLHFCFILAAKFFF